ncbi:MAG: ATP-grasp domain-containing protein [Flavobacteriales bacterium]|nr:ATP-grasp domain-containing protein [Flavobacteriales bacterium]
MKRKPAIVKLLHWEHWPTIIYYAPLLPFFIWRSLKAGHPFFYAITNPAILFAGNGTESKFKTLDLLPESLVPKSILFTKNDTLSELEKTIKKKRLVFPIIAKPDIGFRGYLVKKINSIQELQSYLRHVKVDVILQEFVPYDKELGIFYHRIPGQKKGKITSVTIKKFMKIKGDGHLSIAELIENDDRAFLYADLFHAIHKNKLEYILNEGEEITLSVIGNHSKGTQFINGNYLINDDLEGLTDKICHQIKGWYYGRLDIKFNSYDKLLKEKEYKILEVNGIISEPTHIYDATHKDASFYQALKSINRHWRIMAKIARKLHREQHIPYPSVRDYLNNMLWLRSHTQKLKKLNTTNF